MAIRDVVYHVGVPNDKKLAKLLKRTISESSNIALNLHKNWAGFALNERAVGLELSVCFLVMLERNKPSRI